MTKKKRIETDILNELKYYTYKELAILLLKLAIKNNIKFSVEQKQSLIIRLDEYGFKIYIKVIQSGINIGMCVASHSLIDNTSKKSCQVIGFKNKNNEPRDKEIIRKYIKILSKDLDLLYEAHGRSNEHGIYEIIDKIYNYEKDSEE